MKMLLALSCLVAGNLASLTNAAERPVSPADSPSPPSGSHCFELRTYYAAPGKLAALNARFREHTLKLFEKHGMTSLGYWMPLDNTNTQLIYMLIHKSQQAAAASFASFRSDPAWISAKAESEKNGSLTLPGTAGVRSVFMEPTDYSPTK